MSLRGSRAWSSARRWGGWRESMSSSMRGLLALGRGTCGRWKGRGEVGRRRATSTGGRCGMSYEFRTTNTSHMVNDPVLPQCFHCLCTRPRASRIVFHRTDTLFPTLLISHTRAQARAPTAHSFISAHPPPFKPPKPPSHLLTFSPKPPLPSRHLPPTTQQSTRLCTDLPAARIEDPWIRAARFHP